MKKIILPIDTKSLYLNILNDNLKGHTCTVATPIKQGNSINKDLEGVYKIPMQIDFQRYENLIKELIKNSKSVVKIKNVFVFDKLKLNGEVLNADASYCFYTKEEIDPSRVQFGRVKLHYPNSLKYDELDIDNRKVMNAISNKLNGYAFIVESFDYDFEDNYLNFNVVLCGYTNIPYSKVFINNKGVGSKYIKTIKNRIDYYDTEILPLKRKYGDDISIEKFEEFFEEAEEKAKDIIYKHLEKIDYLCIRDVSKEYPYSLYDLQYIKNGKLTYGIVFATYTNKEYFYLTSKQNQFINLFDNVEIFLVKSIEDKNEIVVINKDTISEYSVYMNIIGFTK